MSVARPGSGGLSGAPKSWQFFAVHGVFPPRQRQWRDRGVRWRHGRVKPAAFIPDWWVFTDIVATMKAHILFLVCSRPGMAREARELAAMSHQPTRLAAERGRDVVIEPYLPSLFSRYRTGTEIH